MVACITGAEDAELQRLQESRKEEAEKAKAMELEQESTRRGRKRKRRCNIQPGEENEDSDFDNGDKRLRRDGTHYEDDSDDEPDPVYDYVSEPDVTEADEEARREIEQERDSFHDDIEAMIQGR
jgi:hypothetical protein